MRAGTLRERITIQSDSGNVVNDYGETMPSWTDVATVWANVRAASGRERIAFGQETATLAYVIEIRYRDDIAPDDRVIWGDRALNIESVRDPDGRTRRIVLECSEVVA